MDFYLTYVMACSYVELIMIVFVLKEWNAE